MADFDVIVASNATIVDWLDPPALDVRPSRLNSKPGYPQKRWLGDRGRQILLKCVVNGVVAPAEATLGGRPFTWWVVEMPPGASGVVPSLFTGLISALNWSSVATFTPDLEGHHTIGVRRPNGGNMHVHLDIG